MLQNITEEKARLRAAIRARRREKPPQITAGQELIDRLMALECYKKASNIFCYISTSGEVQTKTLIACALLEKKAVFVPRCNGDGTMQLCRIRSFAELAPGAFGILEPVCCNETAGAGDIELAILPGLAFDRKGNRLGQGKGYYDRFLASFTGPAAGLCYEAFIEETIPTEQNDRKVQLLVSEQAVYTIKEVIKHEQET